jgi:hypothetical protein
LEKNEQEAKKNQTLTVPHVIHEAYWHPNALLNSDATENKGKAEISNLS